jgi:hypothetical protein
MPYSWLPGWDPQTPLFDKRVPLNEFDVSDAFFDPYEGQFTFKLTSGLDALSVRITTHHRIYVRAPRATIRDSEFQYAPLEIMNGACELIKDRIYEIGTAAYATSIRNGLYAALRPPMEIPAVNRVLYLGLKAAASLAAVKSKDSWGNSADTFHLYHGSPLWRPKITRKQGLPWPPGLKKTVTRFVEAMNPIYWLSSYNPGNGYMTIDYHSHPVEPITHGFERGANELSGHERTHCHDLINQALEYIEKKGAV